MVWHCWRCDCGAVIEHIGVLSLTATVRAHEDFAHGRKVEWTTEQVLKSSRYSVRNSLAPVQYGVPYSETLGLITPTLVEHEWLRKQLVSWNGDVRFDPPQWKPNTAAVEFATWIGQGALWNGDNRSPEELAARYKEKL